MKKIISELLEKKNIRSNLSELRKRIKEKEKRDELFLEVEKDEALFYSFLKDEDAKTRKNIALLLGDLKYQNAVEYLYRAYCLEETLFVKSSYLQAMAELDVTDKLPDLKQRLSVLLEAEVETENKKHIEEEIRALRKIIIHLEGIQPHTPNLSGKKVKVILITNHSQRETIRRTIDCGVASIHPLGVQVETENLEELLKLRTYRELVFPIETIDQIPSNPVEAAKKIWESDVVALLNHLHNETGTYYFRIECRGNMDLEKRSNFTKKLASELETLSKGVFVNSTSDYEVEIRLIERKEGTFFPCLRLLTIKNPRFAYRKHAIATSIHPSTAALIMELAKGYLKENAQIIDPFCGVGTMLIERNKKVAAKEMYGTDIFGDAIAFARENTKLAGAHINYIHRDFMDFRHDYLFDEVITNMPIRGKKTKQEMDDFYAQFFNKIGTHLTKNAVIIMYTNELGFVKKQLRIHKEFELLQETSLHPKNDFTLFVIGTRK